MLHEFDASRYHRGPEVSVLVFRQVVDRIRQVDLVNKLEGAVRGPVEDLDATGGRTGQVDALVQAAVYQAVGVAVPRRDDPTWAGVVRGTECDISCAKDGRQRRCLATLSVLSCRT